MLENCSDEEYEGVSFKKQIVSEFILKELFFKSGAVIPKHSHETANFCIIFSGGCEEKHERVCREIKTRNWDFFPAGISHTLNISPKSGMHGFSIEIPESWLGRAREHSPAVEEPVLSTGGNLGWLLMRLYREFQFTDEATPLSIEGLVLEMLAEISRCPVAKNYRGAPKWLENVKDYLHAHFTESVNLSKFSALAGIHPGHLSREFPKYCQLTIGDYIRRLRIEEACRLIAITKLPLSQIALAVGFSDQSHFSRIFKRQMNVTPAEYQTIFKAR